MAKSKRINENFIHSCGLAQIPISTKIVSISKMGFTSEQLIKVLDFYLLSAPILKSEKIEEPFGLKSLRYYKWAGSSAMTKLEGQLLKSSGINTFCILKSNSIEETLAAMNLGYEICTEHPRAVLKQNAKAVMHEDGSVEVRQEETRMECLFRHIRNSIAHNHTYLFDNDNIMLEDNEENGNTSARIVMPRKALLDWIEIITQGNNSKKFNES